MRRFGADHYSIYAVFHTLVAKRTLQLAFNNLNKHHFVKEEKEKF
jgi:hypothetical protein